jgi:hypothetical protein
MDERHRASLRAIRQGRFKTGMFATFAGCAVAGVVYYRASF